MREITQTIYMFDELSEDAQKRALEKMYASTEYPFFDDFISSVKSFCLYFGIKIRNYELSHCSSCSFIKTDAESFHFDAFNVERFKEEWPSDGYYIGEELCRVFVEYVYATPDDVLDAFKGAIEDAIHSLAQDIEYTFSDEGLIESINANEYEFLENGELY